MKITVFKYTVDGISSYDDAYHDQIEKIIDEFRVSDRAKWLGRNGLKLTMERYSYDMGFKYEHRYVTTLTGALLTEYLLHFSAEPLER